MTSFHFPTNYETMDGTPGIGLEDAAHVMVVGAGRNGDGTGLNPRGLQRLVTAACFYADHNLAERDGRMLLSSYRTPADRNGKPWQPPADDPTEPQWLTDGPNMPAKFQGVPESYSFHTVLESISQALITKYGRDVPRLQRRLDPVTIDTTLNFGLAAARSDAIFGEGDKRPVAIVAQDEGHLERALWIAGKTLHRPSVGMIAPQVKGAELRESPMPLLFGRVALFGLNKDLPPDELYRRLTKRVDLMWRAILWAKDHKPGERTPYNTFGDYQTVELVD